MQGPVSIGVFSVAARTAALMAIVGLVAGALYSFGGAAVDVLVTIGVITSTSTPGLSWGTALAFMAIIGMPVFFAVFGFAAGLTGAFLYGLIAGRVRLWNSEGDKPWVLWAFSIVGFGFAGAVAGAIYGVLTGGFEASFTGGFYGALIGGGVLGSIAALLSQHLHGPPCPNADHPDAPATLGAASGI